MVRVLMIDDDSSILGMLHNLFEMEGITSVGVSLGKDAVCVAATAQPDVILIDLMLQGEQCGIEVAAELRDTLEDPVPMVAMSGSPYQVEIARETELFRDVIEKPFDLDAVLLSVADLAPA